MALFWDGVTRLRLGVDSDGEWIPSGQTQDDRAVGGVATAGGCEGAPQLGVHPGRNVWK